MIGWPTCTYGNWRPGVEPRSCPLSATRQSRPANIVPGWSDAPSSRTSAWKSIVAGSRPRVRRWTFLVSALSGNGAPKAPYRSFSALRAARNEKQETTN
jgi:hypothetical protein